MELQEKPSEPVVFSHCPLLHPMTKFSNNSVLWVNILKVPVKYSYYLHWEKNVNTVVHLIFI